MNSVTTTYEYTAIIDRRPVIFDSHKKITQDDVLNIMNRMFWVKSVHLNELQLSELETAQNSLPQNKSELH